MRSSRIQDSKASTSEPVDVKPEPRFSSSTRVKEELAEFLEEIATAPVEDQVEEGDGVEQKKEPERIKCMMCDMWVSPHHRRPLIHVLDYHAVLPPRFHCPLCEYTAHVLYPAECHMRKVHEQRGPERILPTDTWTGEMRDSVEKWTSECFDGIPVNCTYAHFERKVRPKEKVKKEKAPRKRKRKQPVTDS